MDGAEVAYDRWMEALTATQAAWAWGQRYLPENRASRYLVLAILGSALAHALIAMSILFTGWLSHPVIAQRGELLFIDTATDPTEKAAPEPPIPARPAPESAADERSRPAPRAQPRSQPSPPEPRAAAAAPRIPDPAPERSPDPPREIAKAAPPAGEEPAYEGRGAQPPNASPPSRPSTEAAPPPVAPAPASEPRVASVPRPPPSFGGGAPVQPRGGGGGMFQGSQGGVVGQPVPLDTPDPNYRDYMARVRQQIYAKWVYPREAQDRDLRGRLVVEFQIGKDGRLLSLDLVTSSGEYILDSSALNAIKLAERYPPLPDAMQRDVLPIVAIFSYRIRTTQSSTFQLLQ